MVERGPTPPKTGRPLPSSQIRGYVVKRGPGDFVTIAVCVNPSLPTELDPGAYEGAALIEAGPHVKTVPLTIQVQDDDRWAVILAAAIGVIAGLAVKLFADRRDPKYADRMQDNLFSLRTGFAIAAGIVTAVYSYLTIYDDDPTFNASFANLWRLTVEVFAGTLASKALTDIGSRHTRVEDGDG